MFTKNLIFLDVDGFFENMEFEELEVRQEPSKPIEIKLSGIDMQDFRGEKKYKIENLLLKVMKLILQEFPNQNYVYNVIFLD